MEEADPESPAARLAVRLASVRERVRVAAERAGRDPAGVRIVAVTKTVGVATVVDLARLGHLDFGENRPQALVEKRRAFEAALAQDAVLRERVAGRVQWHLIGHVQRNKARAALASADVLHSLDSLRLAETVSAETLLAARPPLPCLLQVNVSGERTKGGFPPDELPAALRALSGMSGLRVTGFMTMAPWSEDPAAARPVFRGLRDLRDAAANSGYLSATALSMGMSEDFEAAVDEGATILRIGRALVGEAST